MEKFIIQGGRKLEGEIEARGYKNSAGALIAASIIPEGEVIIENIPLIEDVFNLLEVVKSLGVKIDWLEARKLKITTGAHLDSSKMDLEKFAKTRISLLLMGALLAKFHEFKIPHAGGDKIGLRPIDTHIAALRELGAEISESSAGGLYHIKDGKLKGKEIILKEFSVTATENVLMAAVKAQGRTIIKGAAAEPQVQDLGEFLKKMGAKIEGLGAHTITVDGVESLRGGVSHIVMPDPLEVGTFMAMAAITQGKVKIKNAITGHLDLFLDKMKEIGVKFKIEDNAILVEDCLRFNPCRVQALPYPAFPTDLLPIIAPILTQAQGKSLIHDPLYESRFSYIDELRKMGADIEVVDPHRALVYGKTKLKGAEIESGDIRAGACLVIAALCAEGQTVIKNIGQIDRGYEKIEERLQKLGAEIRRVS